jgi:hypothetical protein
LQLGRRPFLQATDNGEISPRRELAHLGKEFQRGWVRNVVVNYQQLPAALRQSRQGFMAVLGGRDLYTLQPAFEERHQFWRNAYG